MPRDSHECLPEPTDFARITDALSRRGFLGGAAGLGVFALATTALTPLSARASSRLGFTPVAANGLDTVTVPEGYRWQVVVSWGDPLWSGAPAFDPATRGTAASQARAYGDNTDGMALFVEGERSVLAANNEYPNVDILHGDRASMAPENAGDVAKARAAVGVSVVELALNDGNWRIVQDSTFNRRITADTPMMITGPAAGHALLQTAADPAGASVLGTLNNCANGRTPWGTYLTCEENFSDFFSSSNPDLAISPDFKRYCVGIEDDGYGWGEFDERFDISRNPNEPNRFGYVVEIDPFDPSSTPKKRTALGRFKHENAALVIAQDGRVVVYLGDDERGEFLYRFVSDGVYMAGGDNTDLLENGTLYVARFHDDMSGEWLELSPETTGMASAAEIAIHTRQAGSAVGATTMDRPEWISVNPLKPEAYCCLTHNKNRAVKTNAGGDETPVGGPNPRAENNYGQIVRWRPEGDDHTASAFAWDLYVVAGNPTVHDDAYAGSANVNADNMFNSPDGLAFDSNEGDFAGMGNNQMLVGDPESGEIARFLVGPRECEITGVTWSGDRRTLFVGIPHPGEKGDSHFPAGGDSVPRSSVIAIMRDDGGLMG